MTVDMSYVFLTSKSLTPQLEHVIQLVASLPTSDTQKLLISSLISTLWATCVTRLFLILETICSTALRTAATMYTLPSVEITIEYYVSKLRQGRYSVRKECDSYSS